MILFSNIDHDEWIDVSDFLFLLDVHHQDFQKMINIQQVTINILVEWECLLIKHNMRDSILFSFIENIAAVLYRYSKIHEDKPNSICYMDMIDNIVYTYTINETDNSLSKKITYNGNNTTEIITQYTEFSNINYISCIQENTSIINSDVEVDNIILTVKNQYTKSIYQYDLNLKEYWLSEYYGKYHDIIYKIGGSFFYKKKLSKHPSTRIMKRNDIIYQDSMKQHYTMSNLKNIIISDLDANIKIELKY